MKKVWMEYLKKTGKLLAVFALCAVILVIVFFLYDISLEPILYGGILCGMVIVLFLFYGYLQYRNRKKRLVQLRAILPVDLEEMPEAEDGNEEIYQEMLLELNRKRMSAEAGKLKMYEEVTDYYTMWAHQIKTPIAAMRLLLQENPEKNSNELGELFKIEQYVEMVLGYLRAEDMSADMKFDQVSLDSIIREQIRKYARIFIGKKISLDFSETGEDVLTDSKWLGFVIGQQTLVIEDTGIGIQESDLPRVFEKGFTGYNGRGDGKSTGIGLYLCAKIMKRLGNQISIETAAGKGTRVRLDLKRVELELM